MGGVGGAGDRYSLPLCLCPCRVGSWLELVKRDKGGKVPLKADDKDVSEAVSQRVKEAVARKEEARTTEEKLAAAQALEEAKAQQKAVRGLYLVAQTSCLVSSHHDEAMTTAPMPCQDQRRRLLEKHMFKQEPTEASLTGRISKWVEDIRRLEVDIRNRDENKEVALGTSKINYMDPRITVAWCKRCEVPIDKVFPRTLRDKFNWAMAVPPDWEFK